MLPGPDHEYVTYPEVAVNVTSKLSQIGELLVATTTGLAGLINERVVVPTQLFSSFA
jgi:hypothetical protein